MGILNKIFRPLTYGLVEASCETYFSARQQYKANSRFKNIEECIERAAEWTIECRFSDIEIDRDVAKDSFKFELKRSARNNSNAKLSERDVVKSMLQAIYLNEVRSQARSISLYTQFEKAVVINLEMFESLFRIDLDKKLGIHIQKDGKILTEDQNAENVYLDESTDEEEEEGEYLDESTDEEEEEGEYLDESTDEEEEEGEYLDEPRAYVDYYIGESFVYNKKIFDLLEKSVKKTDEDNKIHYRDRSHLEIAFQVYVLLATEWIFYVLEDEDTDSFTFSKASLRDAFAEFTKSYLDTGEEHLTKKSAFLIGQKYLSGLLSESNADGSEMKAQYNVITNVFSHLVGMSEDEDTLDQGVIIMSKLVDVIYTSLTKRKAA